jgi:phage recombination protein Bet
MQGDDPHWHPHPDLADRLRREAIAKCKYVWSEEDQRMVPKGKKKMTSAPTNGGDGTDHFRALIPARYRMTEQELALCREYARRYALDPFRRQIVFEKRTSQKDGSSTVVPIVTIDGLRLTAERTGKYEGQTAPAWCGTDGQWRDVWLEKGQPAAARVGVYRAGAREAIVAVARFGAYAGRSETWQSMGDVMLAKCAEALALRKAFPGETSGLYTDDEMAQAGTPAIEQSVGTPAIERSVEYEPSTGRPAEDFANARQDGKADRGPGPGVIEAQKAERHRRFLDLGVAFEIAETKEAFNAAWGALKAAERKGQLDLEQVAKLRDHAKDQKKRIQDAEKAPSPEEPPPPDDEVNF